MQTIQGRGDGGPDGAGQVLFQKGFEDGGHGAVAKVSESLGGGGADVRVGVREERGGERGGGRLPAEVSQNPGGLRPEGGGEAGVLQ